MSRYNIQTHTDQLHKKELAQEQSKLMNEETIPRRDRFTRNELIHQLLSCKKAAELMNPYGATDEISSAGSEIGSEEE